MNSKDSTLKPEKTIIVDNEPIYFKNQVDSEWGKRSFALCKGLFTLENTSNA